MITTFATIVLTLVVYSEVNDDVVRALRAAESLETALSELSSVGISMQHSFGSSLNIVRIVIAGLQSVGKSSFIDALLGIRFSYVFQGTGTRCPVYITSMDSPIVEYTIGEEVVSSLTELQNRMSQEMQKYGNSFSSKRIAVSLKGPGLPNLVLIDLPGIRNKNEEHYDTILRINKPYLEDEANYVVCVMRAPNDIQSWADWDSMADLLTRRPEWERRTMVVANRFNLVMPEYKLTSEWNAYIRGMRMKYGAVFLTTMGHPIGDSLSQDEWAQHIEKIGDEDQKRFLEWEKVLRESRSDEPFDKNSNQGVLGFDNVRKLVNRVLEEGTVSKARKNAEDAKSLQAGLTSMIKMRNVSLENNSEENLRYLVKNYTKEFARHMVALHDNERLTDYSRDPVYLSSSYGSHDYIGGNIAKDYWEEYEDVLGADCDLLLPRRDVEQSLSNTSLGSLLKKQTVGKLNIRRVVKMMMWYIGNVKVGVNRYLDKGSVPLLKLVTDSAKRTLQELEKHAMLRLYDHVVSIEEWYWAHLEDHLLDERARFSRLRAAPNTNATSFHKALKRSFFRLLREKVEFVSSGFAQEIETLSHSLSFALVERVLYEGFMISVHNLIFENPLPTETRGKEPIPQFREAADLLAETGTPHQNKRSITQLQNPRLEQMKGVITSMTTVEDYFSGMVKPADWIEPGILSLPPSGHLGLEDENIQHLSQILYDVAARQLSSWLERTFDLRFMSILDANIIEDALNRGTRDFFEEFTYYDLAGVDEYVVKEQVVKLQTAVKAARAVYESYLVIMRKRVKPVPILKVPGYSNTTTGGSSSSDEPLPNRPTEKNFFSSVF